MPQALAASGQDEFPDITFKAFSKFVKGNFSSKVSLTTVLIMLFTITNNPDLLNLHAKQQQSKKSQTILRPKTGWMTALAQALMERLEEETSYLFHQSEEFALMSSSEATTKIGIKLDSFSDLLGLQPFDESGKLRHKLKPISHSSIQPVLAICPSNMKCTTDQCSSKGLKQNTRARDISKATLIKGNQWFNNVYVLSGKCATCETIYYADHESYWSTEEHKDRIKNYLNSAKYLKVGQQTWVDRQFSGAVVNAVYSFHASSSAITEFWNDSFLPSENAHSVSRRQIWQAFVQETIRQVAEASSISLQIQDGIAIDDVTRQAYQKLGENGIIRSAEDHFCSECTHDFKKKADVIAECDAAAVVGVDESHAVPAFSGSHGEIEEQDAMQRDNNAMDVDDTGLAGSRQSASPVKLVVMDGIVMGPRHCAYQGCIEDLANAQRGVFCYVHEMVFRNQCHIKNCSRQCLINSQTCDQHQSQWHQHVVRFGRQSILGIRRLLRRTEEERHAWLPPINRQQQPHDEVAAPNQQRNNYFNAARFYCVETICAPCVVVIAWTKFDKAESPTNILNFLNQVYPTKELHPNYVCIDKACLVLRTALNSMEDFWSSWKLTTRFIVDSYHYINHRSQDYLCRKWCNPAPLNGSAPNLVVVEKDSFGREHYKRAFNTQVHLLAALLLLLDYLLNFLCCRPVSS